MKNSRVENKSVIKTIDDNRKRPRPVRFLSQSLAEHPSKKPKLLRQFQQDHPRRRRPEAAREL